MLTQPCTQRWTRELSVAEGDTAVLDVAVSGAVKLSYDLQNTDWTDLINALPLTVAVGSTTVSRELQHRHKLARAAAVLTEHRQPGYPVPQRQCRGRHQRILASRRLGRAGERREHHGAAHACTRQRPRPLLGQRHAGANAALVNAFAGPAHAGWPRARSWRAARTATTMTTRS
jgi:hypothetical protein